MHRRTGVRNAPPWPQWARSAKEAPQEAAGLWRDLEFIVRPGPRDMEEVNRRLAFSGGSASALRSEPNGPTAALVNSQRVWGTTGLGPLFAEFTVFAFLVRRDSTTTGQALCSHGTSWSFYMNFGSGQLGVVWWDFSAQNASSLGAIPIGTPSTVAWSNSATRRLLMMNGRFETLSAWAMSAKNGVTWQVGGGLAGALPVDCGLHVLYMYNRALSETELFLLHQDPWLPIRPRRTVYEGGAALTGRVRVSQAAAEILQAPVSPLRVSQLVAEVLIPVVGEVRVSQILAEVLVATATTGRTRVSALAAEVLRDPQPRARVSQLLAEVLQSPTATLRLSQIVAEVLHTPDPALYVSQIVAEILVAPGALSVPLTGQLFPRGSPLPFPYT